MLEKSYDVVVVGCGPGGAVAGKVAAENGAKVLIVEKKREIGLPVVDAASVIFSVEEIEKFSGVKFNRTKLVETKLYGNSYFSPSGYTGGYQEWKDGAGVRRSVLEISLAEAAARAGAQIMVDTKMVDLIKEQGKVKGVIIKRGNEVSRVLCSIVIGADGIYGNVARLSGIPLPKEYFVGLGYDFIGVKALKPFGKPIYENYLVPQILPGFFFYVSPREEDRFHIGVVYQPYLLKEKISARAIHNKFMQHLKDIGRYDFSKVSAISMMSGASTTANQPAEKIVTDGIMLIGDAAWRPLCGSEWGTPGVPTAIRSGDIAGKVAVEAINNADVSEKGLSKYPERLEETLQGQRSVIEIARGLYFKIVFAEPDDQDKIIQEIGSHVSSLHLFLRGALPLSNCIEPIKKYFDEKERG